MDQAEARHNQKLNDESEKRKKIDFEYLELCYKADTAINRNQQEPNPIKWRNSRDILALLHPLKKVGDKPLPTFRDDIIQRYKDFAHRKRREVQEDVLEFWMRKESNQAQTDTKPIVQRKDQMDEEGKTFKM